MFFRFVSISLVLMVLVFVIGFMWLFMWVMLLLLKYCRMCVIVLVFWILVRNWLLRFLFLDVFFIRFVMFMNVICVGMICLEFVIVVSLFR